MAESTAAGGGISALKQAKSLWDASAANDAQLFALDDPDFDPRSDVVGKAAIGSNTTTTAPDAASDGIHGIGNGIPQASAAISGTSALGTLSARHRQLLDERVQQLRQKEQQRANTLSRRKARREKNARLAANPHVSKPTLADFRVGTGNPVTSTFHPYTATSLFNSESKGDAASTRATLLAEQMRAPGEGYLLEHVKPDTQAAVVSAKMGKYTLSLRDARHILEQKGALSYRFLPPTRESWQADPMQKSVKATRRSLGIIAEEDDGSEDDDQDDTPYWKRQEKRHGPLQRMLLKVALEISEWVDSLVVGSQPTPGKSLQLADSDDPSGSFPANHSVTDVREAALEHLEKQKNKAEDERNEDDLANRAQAISVRGEMEKQDEELEETAEEAARTEGNTTITPATYEAPSTWQSPPRHGASEEQGEEQQAQDEQADNERNKEDEEQLDIKWIEIERTPQYMCWVVPDAFDRLLLHCLARIYGCSSFSCDEKWRRRGRRGSRDHQKRRPSQQGADSASAPTGNTTDEHEEETEEMIRCTYIFNPRRNQQTRRRRRGAGQRSSSKQSRARRRRRKRAENGVGERDRSVDTVASINSDSDSLAGVRRSGAAVGRGSSIGFDTATEDDAFTDDYDDVFSYDEDDDGSTNLSASTYLDEEVHAELTEEE